MYGRLDPETKQIRILTIKRSYLPSTQLRCELHQISLGDAPQYRALSYVWGDQSNKKSIIVNNKHLEIGSNLWTALIHLRRRTKDVTLWCDAVCINQEDMSERNHQVLMMRDIYAQAQQVIIWLGDKADRSDLAFSNFRKWSPLLNTNDTAMLASILRPSSRGQYFDRRSWEACRHFFQRPWWRRVWVFQEVVVSRDAIMMCGSSSCPWQSFLRARTVWDNLKNPINVAFLTEDEIGMLGSCEYDIAIAMALVQYRKDDQSGLDLLGLIRLMNRFEATNPRDKLYALLGLGDLVNVSIIPDYSKSVSEVFSDFVRTFVRDTRRLSILAGAGIGYPQPQPGIDVSSWVPDLRFFSMVDDCSTFDAASGTNAMVTFLSDSRFLSAKGVPSSATLFKNWKPGNAVTLWEERPG